MRRMGLLLLIAGLASLAYGLNYAYFSEEEQTVFGDRIKFQSGDTLRGPVRFNGTAAIMGSPVFLDYVITTDSALIHGPGYDPIFLGPPPVYNAPELRLPARAEWVRQQAWAQNHYFIGGDSLWARVRLYDHGFRLWWAPLGTPLDTTCCYSDYALPDSAAVFFDCPDVHLSGILNSVLILGARGRIGLENNVRYASADGWGQSPGGHPEKLAVIAEGEIKVLNTIYNGRAHSSGAGRNQANQNLTSIVLSGLYVALNESFTFDQQNDPDSGFVFCTGPNVNSQDQRGWIFLYGGIMQKRRGYVHRSTCNGSTGYLKRYEYDPELKFWDLHLFEARENDVTPAAVNFGDVAVGGTAVDTLRLANEFVPVAIEVSGLESPFAAAVLDDSVRWSQAIPVSFSPVAAGEFRDTLQITIPYYNHTMSVPLHGNSVTSGGDGPAFIVHRSSFIVSPNPFNPATTITFTLPRAGNVTLSVYDVAGRQVRLLADQPFAAGEHRVVFDGAALPSGIYFVRLAAGAVQRTQKLMLLK